MKAFKWLDRGVGAVESVSIGACMGAAIVLASTQVFARYFFNSSILWAEEVIIYSMIAMSFIGAGAGLRKGAHISIDIIQSVKNERVKQFFMITAPIVGLLFSIYLGYLSYRLVSSTYMRGQLSPALRMPMWLVYMPIFIGSLLMAYRFAQSAVAAVQESFGRSLATGD